MRMKRIVTATLAGCAAIVISGSPRLGAQTAQMPTHPMAAQAKPADMSAKCHAMMAEREKMMADMKVADQKLDGLVVKMNTASATNGNAATAAVVTAMVTQERTMRAGMMKMHEGMMSHMMEHMEAGKDSMAMCPMMKRKG